MAKKDTSLKDVLEKYTCLIKICEHAQQLASNKASSNKYIQQFALPIQGEKVTSKSSGEHIKEYFDVSLQQTIEDYAMLDLIATFEKIFFLEIDNALGKIKKLVKEEYITPSPLAKVGEFFIKNKDDIRNIGGIRALLKDKIPTDLVSKLEEIRNHRDWLAHGKRSDVGQKSILTLKQMYEILQKILDCPL